MQERKSGYGEQTGFQHCQKTATVDQCCSKIRVASSISKVLFTWKSEQSLRKSPAALPDAPK